jgi:hypothetical protein
MRLAVVALAVLAIVMLGIYLLIKCSDVPEIVKPDCDVENIVQLDNGLSRKQRAESIS